MYTVPVKNVILIWIHVAADFSSWENPFCWILLSSHTAVHNVSSKNAWFYLRGHCHTARTCCCVSIGCVGICLGKKKKFQKLFQEISVSSCHLSAMGTTSLPKWDGNAPSSLESLCKPNRARCTFGKGGPSAASTRVPCLTYHVVQQFIAFQCCCMLRATALILQC